MDDKKVSLTYPDMRCLAEHAARCFPDREFFLCTDEEMPYLRGSELYGFCKKAEAVLDAIPVGRHIALLGPSNAAWLAAYFAVLSAGHMVDNLLQREIVRSFSSNLLVNIGHPFSQHFKPPVSRSID